MDLTLDFTTQSSNSPTTRTKLQKIKSSQFLMRLLLTECRRVPLPAKYLPSEALNPISKT